jgi:APA family basic amino acid/polyamine antiporter
MTDSSFTPQPPAGAAPPRGTTAQPAAPPPGDAGLDTEFRRGLGLFDATMVVVGSMIGSGIFIVSADMARRIGSPGWLLVAWLVTGVLTVTAALSYGELAALMPRAGGQYVYLREAFSPLCGFLYGWTLFLVIQTGTIAAVGVAFGKFTGVLWPAISQDIYLIPPLRLAPGYFVSLSTAQLLAIGLIALLTATNMLGLDYGKLIQNLFTVAKTGALIALIVLGLTLGFDAEVARSNFASFWQTAPTKPVSDGLSLFAVSAFGLFVAVCVTQTGSLFSADAWNNITFTAGEVKNPRRTIPLALGLGTAAVILLYLLANVVYLVTLPLGAIQDAPSDRVGTTALERIFPGVGVGLMAAAIMVSTFGCANGLILAGARAYFAMARDGLFFRRTARLNRARVPAWGLALQGLWAALLVLPRTWDGRSYTKEGAIEYGNLYNDLLDYVISAALLFYILTILGIFRLRVKRPDAPRPYRAFGYPVVPALYVVGAAVLVATLAVYRSMTTWPGLVIVLLGVPVYFLWKWRR